MINRTKFLKETYVYNFYAKQIKLDEKILNLQRHGKHLTVNDLPRQFSDIEKLYYFPSKNIILNDLSMGKVTPLYLKGANAPTTIPAFLMKGENGRATVAINISNQTTEDREGNLNIDTKQLYANLQAGSIMAIYYEKYKKMRVSTQILKSGVAVYSKLFVKVLNKLYALNTIPDKMEQANFLSGLFFLVNVLGLEITDTTITYALHACKSPNVVPAKMLLAKTTPEDFKDLDAFITALPKIMPLFKGLTTKVFLENYIQAYSPVMLLSLEYMPTFMYNISSVAVGAYMNNQFSIEQTCGKDLDVLFKAYFSL